MRKAGEMRRSAFSQRLTCVVALLWMNGAASAPLSEASSQLIAKHLVDVGGGRRMNIVCMGHGSPTVVFEYGLGGHMLDWQKVQEPVSALTTTCFYDRAGYGFSDPSPRPMTAQNVTDDLKRLLDKADVQKPIVLVGHSLGGLYATLYADRFSSQVAGLVLIDPAFAGQDLDETPEEQARAQAVFDRSQNWIRNCAMLARTHRLSPNHPADCFLPMAGRTPAEVDYLGEQLFQPFRWDAMLSESQNLHAPNALSEDEREEQRTARSFADMPVIVLTASTIPSEPGEAPEEHAKSVAHWRAGHDRLAVRSTKGESLVVANATHMIQLDQPQAAIDAIRKVVVQVRGAKAP
jgi:pimeloyl-ACP methyl ester carboxylesterase